MDTVDVLMLASGIPNGMQKTEIFMTCDIPTHRRKLDASEDVESLSFSMNGSAYEIDLCPQHRKDLQHKLGIFERAARKVSRAAQAPRGRTPRHRQRNSEIREWARRHGYELSERGRIPQAVISDYESTA